MYKISDHPILPIPEEELVEFLFEGKKVKGQKGNTIAAALHQAGYIVHNHSLKGRNRTLQCGIGKCGACEMIVDGKTARICITKVDHVKQVERIREDLQMPLPESAAMSGVRAKVSGKEDFEKEVSYPETSEKEVSGKEAPGKEEGRTTYKTTVAIIGAGPSGLAVREELNKAGIDNLVIDNNSSIGGQFNMQTHQFFFFEKQRRFGGQRGFDIAKGLAGEDLSGILTDSVVWDILEDKRLAVKNIVTGQIYYVLADQLVVATGAVPFMPPFKNDDIPGVYTAAVVQRMMNSELTLLGKKILTVGAGNIGYLTSYQAMQAGAAIKAIIEAAPQEGGFPVQANRIKRLGIPIITSHVLLEAIPNSDHTGICGAVIARCENFNAIEGTEQIIEDIDCINICTGLVPDNQLLVKGKEVFGRACYGVGDAVRIGEGTSAVLRGRQCAYQIMEELGLRFNYNEYLQISRDYIDSQQHPVRILETAAAPSAERMKERPFVVANCLYGFACNPCTFACRHGAISKPSTSSVPAIDYTRCLGCMECVYQCPGLAIFGYNAAANQVFLPIEYKVPEGARVVLVNDAGEKTGEGIVRKILYKPNKTHVARVNVSSLEGEYSLTDIKGFILQERYPHDLQIRPLARAAFPQEKAGAPSSGNIRADETYICHCEDITEALLLRLIGPRKMLTADELKHITRIGMGPCRGKRCLARARQALRRYGIEIRGDFTPRGPMANLISLGEIASTLPPAPERKESDKTVGTPEENNGAACRDLLQKNHISGARIVKTGVLIAGGGISGSALFRYFSEAGFKPTLINYQAGSSWRCIAGGRPAFSKPEIADLAAHNLEIFRELSAMAPIDFHLINYVNFAHDEQTYRELELSKAWSDARMVEARNFSKEISPYFNPGLGWYTHALISRNCWQASPGKTINLLRNMGIAGGGTLMEGAEVIDIQRCGKEYEVLVRQHGAGAGGGSKSGSGKAAGNNHEYILFRTELFINALGANGGKFALRLGYETNHYPVKHQAFITKRLPLLGAGGQCLDMLIDRRHYKGFSAVYGQQLKETGQIIGCASPALEPAEVGNNLKINSREFLEIVSEIFTGWLPCLKDVGFQATWSGYYTEPRYMIDPDRGLFIGLRGHGFMLSQYIAKLYVDYLQGKPVPEYFRTMGYGGSWKGEQSFK